MDLIDPSLLEASSWTIEFQVIVLHLIVYAVSGHFSGYFFPQYRTLSKAQKKDWCSRIPSTLNAIITSAGAFLLLTSSSEWSENPWLHATPASLQLISILWGYFFYDLWIVLLNRELFSLPMVAHHMLGVVLYGSLGKVLQQAHYLLLLWTITEMTTPFVNLRSHLYALGAKNSKLYIINGFLMAFGFLIIRATYIPYLTLTTMINHYDSCVEQVSPLVRSFMYFSLALISVLNIYWTFLLWKGLIKGVKTMLVERKSSPLTQVHTKGNKEA